MTDTPEKPRKTLGVTKPADSSTDTPRDPFATVRSGPRGRVALQRAREQRAAEPAPPPAPRKPRPAPSGKPRPAGERAPWPKRDPNAPPRPPRDANAPRGPRPPRDPNAPPRPPRDPNAPPRPPREGAPRPQGERAPWPKRDAASDRGARTEGARPPRPQGDRAPWPKRDPNAPPRPPRDADAPRGPRPPRDPNAPPRPPRDGAPRPQGERAPWPKRDAASDRGARTEGARPPRPQGDRAPWPKRDPNAPPRPPRDADAPRGPRPPRDPNAPPRPPRPQGDRAPWPKRDPNAPPRPPRDGAPRPQGERTPWPKRDAAIQPRSERRDTRPAPPADTRPVIDESDIPPSQRRYDRGPRSDERPSRKAPAEARRDGERRYTAPVRVTEPAPAPAPGTFRWFAPCPRGLEQPLLAELNACGASDARAVPGGCQFIGPLELGWRVNLHSRIASRVLREITQTAYRNEHDLYDAALAIDWPALFDPSQTFKVETVGVNANVPSIEFVTLRVKDAICDRMRDATGTRPDVETRTPDVRVHLFMDPSVAVFYVDTSGEALFKRGWRLDKVAAPLRENLAAGMLALAGWTPGMPLLDPFCGSGTIPIEAALIAQGRAAGANRAFGFQHLKDFDAARWQTLLDEAQAQAHEQGNAHIYAGDISINAIPIARTNAARAGVHIELKQVDAREMQAPCEQPGVMLCNPPYGERVHVRGKVSQAREDALDEQFDDDHAFFAEFATTLKRRFAGWKVAILSSDPELPSKMRLKPAKAWQLYNGALACRLYVFEIVAGSNRDH